MEYSSPKQCFRCFLLLMAEKKNEPLFTDIKPLQLPEAQLYLGSNIFYFKNSCIIYMLFYKISVFILKMFLAKIWRKLKVPGTPACVSLKFCTPLGMLPSNSQECRIMVLKQKVKRYFQYCCKADDKSIQGKTSLYFRSFASSLKACAFFKKKVLFYIGV